MVGRGLLLNRLAQIRKEEEKKKENSLSLCNTNSLNLSVSVENKETLVTEPPKAVRGRRYILERASQALKNQNLRLTDNLSSSISSLELGDDNIQKGQTIPVISKCSIGVNGINGHNKANGNVVNGINGHNGVDSNRVTISAASPKQLAQAQFQPESQSHDLNNSLLQKQHPSTKTTKEAKPSVIWRAPVESVQAFYHIAQLSSNCLKVEINSQKSLYEYRVGFDPPIDDKFGKMYVINQFSELLPVKNFDGYILYTPSMLPQNETVLMGKTKKEEKVMITISFKRKNNLNESVNFYNNILRASMKILGLIPFGKNFFDPQYQEKLPNYDLEIWPGYSATLKEFENGLYICCDVKHRVLQNKTVYQKLKEMASSKTDFKNACFEALCGFTVITRYNFKTYRIDDLDFDMTPLSTFEKNGRLVSYVDYYKYTYNINIQDVNQPMIITKSKKTNPNQNSKDDLSLCILVPELCYLTGLSKEMIEDFKLQQTLRTSTSFTPDMRQKALVDFVNRTNDNPKTRELFGKWGIKINITPERIEAPVYNQEAILLGNKMRTRIGQGNNWAKDVAKNQLLVVGHMKNWAIFYHHKDKQCVQAFKNQLTSSGRTFGMEINPPKSIELHDSKPEVYGSSIRNTINHYPDLEFIVVIFTNKREDRYNLVKRICCVEYGIPSQMILSWTLSRPEKMKNMTEQIALQMNCKLGGAGWAVNIPLNNTMIVGIDVYHEKRQQLNSVVGFIASMNKYFTNWYSVAIRQKSTHQELVGSIPEAFHKALEEFKKKNGLLPEKIIIFRDGVSDEGFKQLEELELKGLDDFISSYSENYNPQITFIVAQKRINVKIYQLIDNGKYANPKPGTVVDNTITRRNYFDFFLVSQNVNQGTVNPIHYIVLRNDSNLSVVNVQRLTYKLCHIYYNYWGIIKVPAPLQYAHKLAYLIGENVRALPHENLCNSLFFL